MRKVMARVMLSCFALMVAVEGVCAETAIDRGAYLVEGIANCGNCHAPQEPAGAQPTTALSGGPAIPTPAFIACPPNITPDQSTGIGGWTPEQVVTALREGRTPDGRVLRPPMPVPFYRGMSDDDAYAIAAYLLSRQPVSNKVPASQYKVPVPPSYGPPIGHIAAPLQGDRWHMVATWAAWGIACCAIHRSDRPASAITRIGSVPVVWSWRAYSAEQ